ncbi:MAG: UDP-N-acetylglucosamine 2-epimerase (hydrolyzing) [Anaerolineaceae bacterium]|nr:UDP-N-acetylglucosamine 2-epimerase (hydrolyzing) [Anaerolineaceae bacterium]
MTQRKICVVITARPSYSRVRTALQAIKDHPDLELQLVVTASALLNRYGKVERYIMQDGFEINERVYMVLEGENLVTSAKTTGLGLMELATVFDRLQPDIVVTIADRYETIATAIAASYMNIPLAHIQGGEITGNIDEKTRHAITKLADYHLVATDQARDFVIRMGESPDSVFKTGCPSIDIAAVVKENPGTLINPFEKYGGVGADVDMSNGYLVVMQHPVTSEVEQARKHVTETLHAVYDLGLPTLWFWPNVDAGSDGTSNGIRAFREQHQIPNIHFFKQIPPEDFLQLLYYSKCLIGNSSVAIRECSYLGVPAVNIGTREGGRERGTNVVDVDYDREAIKAAIIERMNYPHDLTTELYGDGKAGERIAEVLANVQLKFTKRLTYVNGTLDQYD